MVNSLRLMTPISSPHRVGITYLCLYTVNVVSYAGFPAWFIPFLCRFQLHEMIWCSVGPGAPVLLMRPSLAIYYQSFVESSK